MTIDGLIFILVFKIFVSEKGKTKTRCCFKWFGLLTVRLRLLLASRSEKKKKKPWKLEDSYQSHPPPQMTFLNSTYERKYTGKAVRLFACVLFRRIFRTLELFSLTQSRSSTRRGWWRAKGRGGYRKSDSLYTPQFIVSVLSAVLDA